jgi:hypothetical protein
LRDNHDVTIAPRADIGMNTGAAFGITLMGADRVSCHDEQAEEKATSTIKGAQPVR